MIDSLIKRTLDRCFADDNFLKLIAWNTLQNAIETPKTAVKSLEFLVLKAMITQKLESDTRADVFFSLVLREPINLKNFMDRRRCFSLYQKLKRKIEDKWTGIKTPLEIYQQMRQDPYLMYTILEQTLCDQSQINIRITRTELIIEYSIWAYVIARIPNRENHEFDTYWADKFFKLCAQKPCSSVSLQVKGIRKQSYSHFKRQLEPLIAAANPIVPIDGWQQELERGDRPVYCRFGYNFCSRSNVFVSRFYLMTEEWEYNRHFNYFCFEF